METFMKSGLAALVTAGLAACAGQPAATVENASPEKVCIRETGTHLEGRAGKCAAGPGTVMTPESISRRGAQTVGEALR